MRALDATVAVLACNSGQRSSAATWTFDTPVDTKGAIVLLDNVALDSPVDMSSGKTDTSGTLNAKSVVTTADGDLSFSLCTDFHIPGLAPKLPPK